MGLQADAVLAGTDRMYIGLVVADGSHIQNCVVCSGAVVQQH